MSKRDYYDVLNVSKGATQDEIKRAYRKLAREHHPDVSKAPDAAKRFAEIQEAYDTLSDEAKRRQYDQFGFDGARSSPHARAGARYEDWPGGASTTGTPFEGEDLGSVFDAIFGERSRGGARSRRSPFADAEEEGPDVIRHTVTIPFETAWKGGMAPVRVEEAGKGKSRTIEVQIPPGIADGTQLRVRGAGTSKRGAPDLLLQIRVLPHALFRRGEFEETGKGLDLYLDLPVSIAEASLGGSVSIPTLSGSLDLVIPPGTASGRKLRLKGQGLNDQAGNRGDLYALTKIVPPAGTDLNDDERKALERFALKGVSIRTGPLWNGKK